MRDPEHFEVEKSSERGGEGFREGDVVEWVDREGKRCPGVVKDVSGIRVRIKTCSGLEGGRTLYYTRREDGMWHERFFHMCRGRVLEKV